MSDESWVVIVEPLPRREAEEALHKWLDEQTKLGNPIVLDDIQRETMYCTDRKDRVRFLIRTKGEDER